MANRLRDDWPCPPEDSANALVTVARVTYVTEWGYDTETHRIWWEVLDSADAPCAHHAIKTRVQRSISEHAAVGWE